MQREGHSPEGELEEPEEVVRQPRHTRQRAPAPPREFNAKPDTFPIPCECERDATQARVIQNNAAQTKLQYTRMKLIWISYKGRGWCGSPDECEVGRDSLGGVEAYEAQARQQRRPEQQRRHPQRQRHGERSRGGHINSERVDRRDACRNVPLFRCCNSPSVG